MSFWDTLEYQNPRLTFRWCTINYICSILLKKAKRRHDYQLSNVDYERHLHESLPQLNDVAFRITNATLTLQEIKKKNINIYGSPTANHVANQSSWIGTDIFYRNEPLLRSRIKKLCNGDVSTGWPRPFFPERNAYISFNFEVTQKSLKIGRFENYTFHLNK